MGIKPSLLAAILASAGISLEAAAIAAARRNNAALWYVPDSLAGVYQDAAGTTPAALGSPIGRINDQQYGAANAALGGSALGFAASQATTASKPTVTQLANGRLAMLFNGSSNYLDHPITSLSPSTHSTVLALQTTAVGGGDRVAHAVRSTTGASILGQAYYTGGNTPNYIDRYDNNVTASTSFAGTSAPHILSAVSNAPTARTVYLNGGGGTTLPAVTGVSTTDKASIGAAYQPTIAQFWLGPISLVCVSNTALPPADRIAIEKFGAYLAGVSNYA